MAAVTKVEVGQKVEFNESTYEVKEACQGKRGYWVCATHHETFAHNWAKDSHIESGTHQLAWVCLEDGEVEVP